MFEELKIRLDTLSELREQGYLTDNEYTAAKENLLFDAGLDIMPHNQDNRERALVAVAPSRKNRGCGCLTFLILLIVTAVGVILALPQSLIQDVPALNALFTEQGRESTGQTLSRFIDELRGKTIPSPDPTLSMTLPASSSTTVPTLAQPSHSTPVSEQPAEIAKPELTSSDEARP